MNNDHEHAWIKSQIYKDSLITMNVESRGKNHHQAKIIAYQLGSSQYLTFLFVFSG